MSHIDRLSLQFRRFIEDDALSHSYLFFGGEAGAAFRFAQGLASFLETGSFDISSRPLGDAFVVAPNMEGSIGIDEVRGLRGFLMSRPAVGKRRVAIVDRAEALTPEAQNALLKIAEEPPQKALLVLVTRNFEGLLPTVLSRFQKVSFDDAVSAENPARPAPPASSLVREFLRSGSDKRSQLIKGMLADPETASGIVTAFLDGLILELHRDMPRMHRQVGFVLKRKRLMEEFNTNPRLQLEIISKMV